MLLNYINVNIATILSSNQHVGQIKTSKYTQTNNDYFIIVFNRNGSIIVQYKLYYQYYDIPIIQEKLYQDLKDSLTDMDSGLANFSDFVIIKASVSFLVEVQAFQKDPLVTGAPFITPTTAVTERKTTAIPSNVTSLHTESTTVALTTEGATESISTTLALEITTESDPSTFTTEDTTENSQASLITEITTKSDPATFTAENTTKTQSTEARVETSQSFTETVTDQTFPTLNTLENSTTMDTTEYQPASTTIATSDNPTTSSRTDTTERFAQPTTLNKTEISTTVTTTSTNFETSESLRMTSTTFSSTTTTVEYSAGELCFDLINRIHIFLKTRTLYFCII